MKDLMKLANECMRDLDNLGIEYGNITEWKVNTRAKSRWGQCARISKNEYRIEITNDLLKDELSDRPARETIFHELLHSVDGCMNHGLKWKRLADLVNDCYMVNITVTSTNEEKGAVLERKPIAYKYVFKCTCCGKIVKRQRESRFTKYYQRYGCGYCGKYGVFEKIEKFSA